MKPINQPFILPKEWCLPGRLFDFDRLASRRITEAPTITEPIEAPSGIVYTSLRNIVVTSIVHYTQRQSLWWQASSELESYSQAEEQFQELAAKWRKETRHISSLTKIILHPAYQRIIGMGPVAIKFILQELEQKPHHWFWALESITGENPVQPEDDFDAAVRSWLRWGQERGLI